MENFDKDKILYVWYRIIGAPFRIFPIRKNRILMENYFGKGYGDNPKYIAEELLKKDNNIEIIWLVKNKFYDNIPEKIIQIKRGTLKELYYIATSHIWVDNERKHRGIKKRKSQYYIQTWHGGIGIKKIEKDTAETLPDSYIKNAMHDSKMIDLLLSEASYSTSIFKRCFWYEGEILECGSPRSDFFFQNNKFYSDIIHEKFNLKKDVQIALYAPSFRKNEEIGYYSLNYEILCELLNQYWGGTWVVIVRLHPNIDYLQDKIKYSERVLNGSNYGDINHLIVSCNLLVTDYSSCMADAMYSNKKVLIYATDSETYYSERGVYMKVEDTPFMIARDMKDVENQIASFNEEKYDLKVQQFKKSLGLKSDGHASEIVAEKIVNIINES